MNLYRLMTAPAFQRVAKEMAKHWPASFHPNCLPARLAAAMMFGDEPEDPEEAEAQRRKAAAALDEGQLPDEMYDHRLPDLLPDLVDLADFYDVPMEAVAHTLLAVSRIYWQPDVTLLGRKDVLERMGFRDPTLTYLDRQGRVPPRLRLPDGRSVWTEAAIEGWREVVEERKTQPYVRGVLVYPPYDGKKLSRYTMEQWERSEEYRRKRKNKKAPQP